MIHRSVVITMSHDSQHNDWVWAGWPGFDSQ